MWFSICTVHVTKLKKDSFIYMLQNPILSCCCYIKPKCSYWNTIWWCKYSFNPPPLKYPQKCEWSSPLLRPILGMTLTDWPTSITLQRQEPPCSVSSFCNEVKNYIFNRHRDHQLYTISKFHYSVTVDKNIL